jgi:hypothetical protein
VLPIVQFELGSEMASVLFADDNELCFKSCSTFEENAETIMFTRRQ